MKNITIDQEYSTAHILFENYPQFDESTNPYKEGLLEDEEVHDEVTAMKNEDGEVCGYKIKDFEEKEFVGIRDGRVIIDPPRR